MINPLATEVWLDGKRCGGTVMADIKQEQELHKHPFSDELKPGKLWTTATLEIGSLDVGEWEEQAILTTQREHAKVTLAHTRHNSVLIARNLHITKYWLSDSGHGPQISIELAYGEPLQIVPHDEFLASIDKAA